MLCLLASLALAPSFRQSLPRTVRPTAAVTELRSPSVLGDETSELLKQYIGLQSRSSQTTASKSVVQRAACAAVVAAFNGGANGRTSGGEGDDGGAPAVGPRKAPASRVTAVLPAGAGKTVLALRVAEAVRAQLTVVLVSGRDLVSQSYRDWERWRDVGFLDRWNPLACSVGGTHTYVGR